MVVCFLNVAMFYFAKRAQGPRQKRARLYPNSTRRDAAFPQHSRGGYQTRPNNVALTPDDAVIDDDPSESIGQYESASAYRKPAPKCKRSEPNYSKSDTNPGNDRRRSKKRVRHSSAHNLGRRRAAFVTTHACNATWMLL